MQNFQNAENDAIFAKAIRKYILKLIMDTGYGRKKFY